jgi:hypothetical protein
MIKQSQANRRRFFRQPIELSAFARRLSSPEDPPRFRAGPRLLPAMVNGRAGRGQQLLRQIDDKLDALLGNAALDIVRHDFPLTLAVSELSAGGLRCTDGAARLRVGDPLEIVLRLSAFPPRLIGVLGQVARREGRELIVGFTGIAAADEDQLVRTLLDEQRRLRREALAS